MAIYEVGKNALVPLENTTFAKAGVYERLDLQRLLRSQIEVIAPNTLIISEEFGDWGDSRRRIDMLGVDKEANLVVVELKRTEDGGHMDLQAIRYAAMVSTMTFESAVQSLERHLKRIGVKADARQRLLEFLEWDEPDEDQFAQDVRIVLASAEFSKEITSSVLWLNGHGLDIRCVRLRPYKDGEKLLLDVQQVIPLPEAQEYQVRITEKSRLERVARHQDRDLTKYDVTLGGQTLPHLPKRRAIFSIIYYLCKSGVNPEEIKQLISWKGNVLRSISGKLHSEEFEKALADQLISEGNMPQTARYFVEDDELIYANGKTYALTKMWGTRTAEAIDILIQRYADKSISVKESVAE